MALEKSIGKLASPLNEFRDSSTHQGFLKKTSNKQVGNI